MQRTIQQCLVAALFAWPVLLMAQDGDKATKERRDPFESRESEKCIQLQQIRRTEVIDDQTIAFYVSRQNAYVNSLPRVCPGLARNERFSYQVRFGRICDNDTITVLEGFGTGMRRGFTCQLGSFYPVTQDDIAMLKDVGELGGTGNAVEMNPIELPDPSEVSKDTAAPE